MCEKQRSELRTLHTRKNKFKRDSFMFCPVNVLDKSQFAETDERCNCYANSPLIVSSTKKLKLIIRYFQLFFAPSLSQSKIASREGKGKPKTKGRSEAKKGLQQKRWCVGGENS
jgi:hypothetical protein